jgi:hypothetical protein
MTTTHPILTTTSHRCSEPTASASAKRRAAIALLTLAVAVAVLMFARHGIPVGGALKAAGGFGGLKPIEGVSHFIDALKGSLAWLLVTALIVVVLVIGALFLVGNSNAHRYAMNVLAGITIVACAGGIVA